MELVSLSDIISSLIAQAPMVAVTILVLLLYLSRKCHEVEEKFREVEGRFKDVDRGFEEIDGRFREVDRRFREISRGIRVLIDFNETLVLIQASRGVFTDAEALALRGQLSTLKDIVCSTYFTREAAERLSELLRKHPSELTWSDVSELEEIYERLVKESVESDKVELASYAGKLKLYIGIVKGLLIKRGRKPPM